MLRRRARQRARRARARDIFRPLRRGALRAADRPRDRAAAPQAAVRAHRRPRRRRSRPRSRRPRASARGTRPSASSRRCGSRSTTSSARSSGRCRPRRDAAPRRAARRDQVPLARGPDRQAVPARAGARLHMPARLPGLRLRQRADDARDAAAGDPAVGGRDRPQPARRSRRGCAWRTKVLDGELAHAQRASPSVVRRAATRPARSGAAARSRRRSLWIALSGILLAGVVFLNVAVLRLNLRLDDLRTRAGYEAAGRERRARSRSSRAPLHSPQIEAQASQQLGLEPADPSEFGYVDLVEVGEREKQANRRIRLLLGALRPRLRRRRSPARRGCRASAASLGKMAQSQHREIEHDPCRRAARSTTATASGSRSASRRRPSTPTRGRSRTAADRARRAHLRQGRRREHALPPAARPDEGLRLHRAEGRPEGAARS